MVIILELELELLSGRVIGNNIRNIMEVEEVVEVDRGECVISDMCALRNQKI